MSIVSASFKHPKLSVLRYLTLSRSAANCLYLHGSYISKFEFMNYLFANLVDALLYLFPVFLLVYDMPYSKPNIPAITPKSPMVPQRVSSLNRSVPTHGRQNESDKGPYSSFLTQIANQPLREDVSLRSTIYICPHNAIGEPLYPTPQYLNLVVIQIWHYLMLNENLPK